MTEDFDETGVIVGKFWSIDSQAILPTELSLEISLRVSSRPPEDVWLFIHDEVRGIGNN